MGDLNATDEQVEEAAKKCGLHEFIMGLANGYDTVVGGAVGHLSGGERLVYGAISSTFYRFRVH